MTGRYAVSWATGADYNDLADVMYDAVRNGPSKYSETQRAQWVPERRSGEAWEARLTRQVVVIVRDESRVVGFMSLEPGGYVDFAFIRPEAQGTGLFRLLYGQIEDHARAQAEKRLWVHASLMAESAFAAVGFAVVEREVVQIGDQHLKRARMEKPLNT